MKMNLHNYLKTWVTLHFVFVVLNFGGMKSAYLYYDYLIDGTSARTICQSNNGELPILQISNYDLLNETSYWVEGCRDYQCAVKYQNRCIEKNCSEKDKLYCHIDFCISSTKSLQNVSVISENDANMCAKTCCRNSRCIGINIENDTCLMYEEGTTEEEIFLRDKAIKAMAYNVITGSDTPSICPTVSSSTHIVSTSDYQSSSSQQQQQSTSVRSSSSDSSSKYTSIFTSSSIFTISSSSIGSSSSDSISRFTSSSSIGSSSIDSSIIDSSSIGSSLISSQGSNQYSATSQFISSTSNIESSDLISTTALSSGSQASISPTSTYVAVSSTASFSASIDESSKMVSASTTQTTKPSQDLSSSLEPSFSSKCLCQCQGPTTSLTEEESKSKMSKLRAELTIPKKDLSSTIRKKTSATDNRVSSTGIGMVGVVMMCVVFGGIIILDLGMMASHLGILYDNLFGHCRS